jgi:hypothetical protein
MQQRFHTRNYSIGDFAEWNDRGELVLAPKFQRREVWSDKARSYLIDTILRGKPIPKIYMRQDVNPGKRRAVREIVDGQQRLHTVLNFIKNGFKISNAHHEDYGGCYFTDLDEDVQRDILKYEFVVDLLQDMPDNEVYDVFARINTYSEKLKAQELRNARWFGEFKSSAYLLSKDFVGFFIDKRLFTPKQVLRMGEVEFVSDLLLAIHEGIREGRKDIRDTAYRKYDDKFRSRRQHEKRFRETMDALGAIIGEQLANLKIRGTRLFYPAFCAVFHCKFGLPRLHAPRRAIKIVDYPKIRAAFERIDELLVRIEAARESREELTLSAEDKRFFDAYSVHWVHADRRTLMTQYFCRHFLKALGN